MSRERTIAEYTKQNIEAMALRSGKATIFFGDSNIGRWDLISCFPGKPFLNRGIGGETTSGLLRRLETDLIQLGPESAVFLCGINDFVLTKGGADFRTLGKLCSDNLREAVHLANRAGIEVYLSSLLPYGLPGKEDDFRLAGEICSINSDLQGYCAATPTHYLNFHAALSAPNGIFHSDCSDDGIHPNKRGFQLMTAVVQKSPLLSTGAYSTQS